MATGECYDITTYVNDLVPRRTFEKVRFVSTSSLIGFGNAVRRFPDINFNYGRGLSSNVSAMIRPIGRARLIHLELV